MDETNLTTKAEEMVATLENYRRVLDNIEDKKDTVRPQIYEKVRAEYLDKLSSLHDNIQPILDQVRSDLTALAETETEAMSEKDQVELEKEEVDFRHVVGDMDDQAYEQSKAGIEEKLSGIDKRISEIGSRVKELNTLVAQLQMTDTPGKSRQQTEEPQAIVEETNEENGGPETINLDEVIEQGQAETTDAAPDSVQINPESEPPELETEADSEVLDAEPLETEEKENGFPVPPPPSANTDQDNQSLDINDIERDFFNNKSEEGEGPLGTLHVLEGAGEGKSYELAGDEIRIGRDLENQVQILDPKVSPCHFMIERRRRAFLLRDQDSAGGTFVNNRRVGETSLSDGDEIRIGGTLLQFQLQL